MQPNPLSPERTTGDHEATHDFCDDDLYASPEPRPEGGHPVNATTDAAHEEE